MSKQDYLQDLDVLQDVVTFENCRETVQLHKLLYIVMDFVKYTVFTPATVEAFELYEALDGVVEDVSISLQIKHYDETHELLLSDFNGDTNKIAAGSNLGRVFTSQDRAIDYAETLQHCREVQNDTLWGFFQRGSFGPPLLS